MTSADTGITTISRYLLTAARWCFYALIVLIPIRYRELIVSRPVGTIYGDYTDFILFASDVAVGVTLVLWLAGKATSRQPIRTRPLFVTLPLAALIAIGAITTLFSIDPALSVYHVTRLISVGGLCVYVLDQMVTLNQVAAPMAVQIAIQSVVGIGQFLRQSDLGLQRLGEYLLNPEWKGVSIVVGEGTRWLRAYGLADHPNILGGCLAFGLLILLGHLLTSNEKRRVIPFAAFCLGCTALFLTFSRASWLAFAIGTLGMIVFVAKERAVLVRGLQMVGGAALIIAPFLVSYASLTSTRILLSDNGLETPTEQQSVGERAALNELGSQIFAAHALTGVGLGALPQAMRQANPVLPYWYQPSHNVLITAGAEIGLFGAAAYSVLLIAPLAMFGLSARRRESIPFIAATMALVATTIVGQFDYYPFLLQPGRLWQAVLWGLWGVAYQTSGVEQPL